MISCITKKDLTENSQSKNEKLRHACEGALFEIYESRPSEGLLHRKTDLKSPQRAQSDSKNSSVNIMLSYKWESQSKHVMREFKQQLRKRGYNVWMEEDHTGKFICRHLFFKVLQSFGMGSWIWFKWTCWNHMRSYNIHWSLSRV